MSDWSHLPRPFGHGEVISSNRSPSEYHFTFVSGGETYHHRLSDLPTKEIAQIKMDEFVRRENGEQFDPVNTGNFMTGRKV